MWRDNMPKCLLISNRLPLTFNSNQNEFTPSSGGLVSAIKGISPEATGYEFEWIGLLTDDIEKEKIETLRGFNLGGIKLHPIEVRKKTYDLYYNKYCNNVLWPLFHYERSMVHYSSKSWESYLEINKIVADQICELAKEDDLVWVHDFHFLLVPGLVKSKRPHLKIGFFLHIPFPSSEIFREIPEREELLNSLTKCDVIGFHDLSYLNHFKNSVNRILGKNLEDISRVKAGVYPISIDTQHFIELANDPRTLEFIKNYSDVKKDETWILGVDRLDYIKGLVLKLKTFKEFLKKNPNLVGKIKLLQVVVPSRTDVTDYQTLKNKIEQIISSINGEFSTPNYTPIQYLYHSISEYELSALYQLSELLYIGSRRDGMNLVCLEYVVSQRNGCEGAVLLSEFAGAHSTLSYAYSINPWNIEDTCQKMLEALSTSKEERSSRIQEMKKFLLQYTSSNWAEIFLKDLENRLQVHPPLSISNDSYFDWMKDLKNKRILLFCDLDGTLAPIEPHPSLVTLSEKTKYLLQNIAEFKNINLIIISGRDKHFLEKEFLQKDLNFTLAACHGSCFYSLKDESWIDLIPPSDERWKESVKDILELYTKRTPQSFIEDKDYALTWHYRNSPESFSEFLANKLFIELEENLISKPVQVMRGKKVIEIKSLYANKGQFIRYWLAKMNEADLPDVVISIGDDVTDEDMFKVLQEQTDLNSYCVKVGSEKSTAKYFINDQNKVTPFLENIIRGHQAT